MIIRRDDESSDEDEIIFKIDPGILIMPDDVPEDLKPTMKALRAQRRIMDGLHSKIQPLTDNLANLSEIATHMVRVEAVASKALKLQDDLFEKANDLQLLAYASEWNELDTLVDECRTWFNEMKAEEKDAANAGKTGVFAYDKRKLRKYDGKSCADFVRFESEFKSMISGYNNSKTVTDQERFTLLKDHLTGDAYNNVKSLKLDDDCYQQAWTILRKLYDRPMTRCYDVYSAILDCKKASGANDGYTYAELSRVHNAFYSGYRNIQGLGADPEQNAGFLMTLARRAFPNKLLNDFDDGTVSMQSSTSPTGTTASFKFFLEFALGRMQTQLASETKKAATQQSGGGKESKKSHTTKVTSGGKGNNSKCNICDKGHKTGDCFKWSNMKKGDLYDLLKKKSLCLTCGDKGHMTPECSRKPCSKCSKKHHPKVACPSSGKRGGGGRGGRGGGQGGNGGGRNGDKGGKKKDQKQFHTQTQQQSGQQQQNPPQAPPQQQQLQHQHGGAFLPIQYQGPSAPGSIAGSFGGLPIVPQRQHAVLKGGVTPMPLRMHGLRLQVILDIVCCLIVFKQPDGVDLIKICRAFFDTGSEGNLVTRKISEGANRKPQITYMTVTGGQQLMSQEYSMPFRLRSLDGSYTSPEYHASTLKTLSSKFAPTKVDPSSFTHLSEVNFTVDYPQNDPFEVDVLLSNQVCTEIITGDVIRGNRDQPIAKHSKLGWILSGCYRAQG